MVLQVFNIVTTPIKLYLHLVKQQLYSDTQEPILLTLSEGGPRFTNNDSGRCSGLKL